MRSAKGVLIFAAAAVFYAAQALALYDAPPLADIASAQGCWTGSLTYDDYSQPGKLVKLPTRLMVAMNSPTALTLQYEFDEGRGRHVYSYESMDFDLAKGEVTWISGTTKRETSVSRIVSNQTTSTGRRIVFEHPDKGGLDRYTMDVADKTLSILKEEIVGAASPRFRNRYEFKREQAVIAHDP